MAGQIDLQDIHDSLIELAKESGAMITKPRPKDNTVSFKKNSVDLVTETDKAVEEKVSSVLRKRYPTFQFMGEETFSPGTKLTDKPTFICDPIDGTTNYVHQYPYVSISLGFARNREPQVGIVYNPFTRQLYSAIKGQGSFRRNLLAGADSAPQRLPLTNPFEPLSDLSTCQIAIEWGSDREGPNYDTKVATFNNLAKSKARGGAMCHSFRSFGSAALNLCGLAEGGLDLYWEGGPWAWDVCAGWLILREAGGLVVDGNPGKWEVELDHRMFLAIRPAPGQEGQKEVVEEFWRHIEGRMEYEH